MNSQIDVIESQMSLFGLTHISDLKLFFPLTHTSSSPFDF